jgi:hypothetical protein
LFSELKKKKTKKMKKTVLIAFMTKVAILTKAVLLGAVILAKKAFIVSILSLFLSAMAASKKTTAPNGNKGDHKYRRFGTINYLDHNPDNHGDKHADPLSHTKQWVKSQEYHNQYYPNFIQDHEGNYNRDPVDYGSSEIHAHVPSRYTGMTSTVTG